jgi:AraC-like DNA-binding protein
MFQPLTTASDFLSRQARVVEDFGVAKRMMNESFLPHVLEIGEGPHHFSLQLSEKTIGDVSLHYVSYSHRITVKSPPFKDFYCIHFSANGYCHYKHGGVNGRADGDYLYVTGACKDLRQVLEPGYEQITIKIRRNALELFLGQELGHRIDRPIEFMAHPIRLDQAMASLLQYLAVLTSEENGSNFPIHSEPMQRHLQRALMSTIIGCLDNNYIDEYRRIGHNVLPHYVRRAEIFIRQNAGQDIGLDDIVDASGVCRRTLHHGFRQALAMSPLQYLKSCRLRTAREALLNASETRKTVTEVVIMSGFNHLSKFAQDYAAMFGETPSQTRRRSIEKLAVMNSAG